MAFPHIVAAPNEFNLNFPIHVPVSRVKFSSDVSRPLLAVSCWDGTVRVYTVDGTRTEEKCLYYHGKPNLTCCFAGYGKVASGGLDQTVKVYDIETKKEVNLGNHLSGIRTIEHNPIGGVLITGSWDMTIKTWDARLMTSSGAPLQSAQVSDRVYAMDVLGDKIIAATRDRKIHMFDMRDMQHPLQVRDSPLKYQTRAVAFFPTGEAYVVSSIEGRIAVEYVDAEENSQKKYAFKAHRNKDSEGIENIYPVNTIAFHPVHNTFATGGSDQMVNMWDPFNRKRLAQLHKFNTSIMSLAFSADGSQLAIAASYGHEFEQDPVPLPDNVITVRQINDVECRPKMP